MSKDPYSILGVSPNASDEEIKKAYRELARKYHPDAYRDHPLADLAEEKMKEINEAYDTIQKQREQGSKSGYYDASGRKSSYYNSNDQQSSFIYQEIRSAIQRGDITRAEQLLNTVSDRSAEWYFLMGSICYQRGWYDEARANFTRASNMEPNNAEYRSALARMQNAGSAYTHPGNVNDDMLCSACGQLMCADCLCEACGGNLCPCIGCR